MVCCSLLGQPPVHTAGQSCQSCIKGCNAYKSETKGCNYGKEGIKEGGIPTKCYLPS